MYVSTNEKNWPELEEMAVIGDFRPNWKIIAQIIFIEFAGIIVKDKPLQ